ncbi:hypothetical protein M9H77_00047 [Catharanthus roseus]|nr:hypothetical protein M9H77_00047 [Catharanthus roseus]
MPTKLDSQHNQSEAQNTDLKGLGRLTQTSSNGVVSTCTGVIQTRFVGKGGQPGSESETVGGTAGKPETLKGLVIDPGTRQLAIEANQLAAPQDRRVLATIGEVSVGDRLSMDPTLKGAGTDLTPLSGWRNGQLPLMLGYREVLSKLAQPQESLRWLNNQEFSHIAERAKRARASLKEGQLLLLDNPRDGLLAGKVNILRKEAEFLMEAERSFVPKTKTDFLLKGIRH